MSLVINTNISSLNTQNNLSKSQSALSQATQRLSSGLKINSAADNAAGFAISQRYTTQIGGLAQASSNASDAINLAQTAGSALDQVTANLQAIRDLATQSANGTYSDTDRATMDKEVQQRLAEVTRIANQTTFNSKKVLDGSLQSQSFQIGADVGQTVSVSLGQSVKASDMGAIAEVSTGDISSIFGSTSGSAGGSLTLADGDLTIGGTSVAAGNYTSAADLATAINTAATASGYSSTDGTSFATADGNEITFSNSSSSAVAIAGDKAASLVGVSSVAAKSDAVTTDGNGASTGVAAAISAGGGTLTLAANALTVNGIDLAGSYTSAADLATAINTAIGGGSTAADGTSGEVVLDNSTANAITFGGTSANALGFPASVTAASTTAAADGTETSTGVGAAFSATAGTGTVDLSSEGLSINGKAVTLTGAKSLQDVSDDINAAGISGVSAAVSADGKGINFYSSSELKIADTGGNVIGGSAQDVNASATYTAGTDATVGGSLATGTVGTVDGANDLISRIDVALSSVADFAANLGAVQNRFQSTISTLSSQSTNLQSAQSTIQDADFAAETANLSKAQVLQQAGISVLAQANSNPQQVLKLLQ